MDTYRIAVLVGSLRRDSLNRKLADALAALAPGEFKFQQCVLHDLPPYNQDDDAHPAEPVRRLKSEISNAQGVVFVTPEYNRSVPGVLKNAIDVASRPYGQNAWDGKPGAVISASPGAIGGFGANHHLRQSLVFLNVPTLMQPEVYLSGADQAFDANGELVDRTRKFLQTFMDAYVAWVNRILGAGG